MYKRFTKRSAKKSTNEESKSKQEALSDHSAGQTFVQKEWKKNWVERASDQSEVLKALVRLIERKLLTKGCL